MAQMKRSGDIGRWEDHGEPIVSIRGTPLDATFLEQTTGLPPLVPSRLNAPGLILVREVKVLWQARQMSGEQVRSLTHLYFYFEQLMVSCSW